MKVGMALPKRINPTIRQPSSSTARNTAIKRLRGIA